MAPRGRPGFDQQRTVRHAVFAFFLTDPTPMPGTLVIQIPCFNEAAAIAETLADVPRSMPGISRVVILVVDDGSTDGTAEAALAGGADYVVRHRRNRGLAQAFMTGINTSLALGADVIVNTDADHQYPGRYIPELVAPAIAGAADLVIGDRQPGQNIHFSPFKRLLERLGSWFIGVISGTEARDAASGFRAYTRYAALRIHVHNSYSYTLETLIQAGRQRMAIAHVPIQTNPTSRPSRLHSGLLNFIWRQSGTVIRSYVLYQPLKSFVLLGVPFLLAGGFLFARFLYFYFTGASGIGRHVQSVLIGGTLLIFGLLLVFMGLLGDSVRANRGVAEEVLVGVRDRTELGAGPFADIHGSPILRGRKGGHA
jgi:glycosyltransferase involved in cell wall biosynthesis